MKLLKISFILFLSITILLLLIYFSIPVLIKTYMPDYLKNHNYVDVINLKNVYYSKFSILNIDNVILKKSNNGLNVNIIVPRIKIKFDLYKKINKFLHITIEKPVVLSEIDLEKYFSKNNKAKNKSYYYNSLPVPIENLFINEGAILFKSINLKKLEINDLKMKFNFKDNNLNIISLQTNLFGGTIKGNANFSLHQEQINYKANLQADNIDMQNAVNKLGYKQYKFSGIYDGNIRIDSTRKQKSKISGQLISKKGGEVNIQQEKLENFLKSKKENIAAAISQLKNFSYQNGKIKIYSTGNNLLVNLLLIGENGKKDLEFVFHDVL